MYSVLHTHLAGQMVSLYLQSAHRKSYLTPFTALQPHCSSSHQSVSSSCICSAVGVDLSRRRSTEMKWPDCLSCCAHASVCVRCAHASWIERLGHFRRRKGSAPVSSHISISQLFISITLCVIQPLSWRTILTAHVAARCHQTLQNSSCLALQFFCFRANLTGFHSPCSPFTDITWPNTYFDDDSVAIQSN